MLQPRRPAVPVMSSPDRVAEISWGRAFGHFLSSCFAFIDFSSLRVLLSAVGVLGICLFPWPCPWLPRAILNPLPFCPWLGHLQISKAPARAWPGWVLKVLITHASHPDWGFPAHKNWIPPSCLGIK